MLKGIDVSKHQGKIDWEKAKADGVQVAIIRCGYGQDMAGQDDERFAYNASECERVGIPYGVYLYSYADTVEKARGEAQHALRMLDGRKPAYPVYYDMEDEGTTGKCSRALLGDMAEAFLTAVSAAGYKAGVYASKYWFTSKLTDSRFGNWPKWVAQYYPSCTYQGKYEAWQYSSSGSVDGIGGMVDLDEFYVDYAAGQSGSGPDTAVLPNLSGYSGTSIAGALNGEGYPSDYAYRKELAAKLGISGYKGTAEQNLRLIQLLGGKVQEEAVAERLAYTVRKGDTLSAIAKKYGATVYDIVQLNHIADADKIYAGQEIIIPA